MEAVQHTVSSQFAAVRIRFKRFNLFPPPVEDKTARSIQESDAIAEVLRGLNQFYYGSEEDIQAENQSTA